MLVFPAWVRHMTFGLACHLDSNNKGDKGMARSGFGKVLLNLMSTRLANISEHAGLVTAMHGLYVLHHCMQKPKNGSLKVRKSITHDQC